MPLYIIRKKKPREKINSLLSQGINPEQFYDHEAVLHTLDSLFLLPHSGSRQWVGGWVWVMQNDIVIFFPFSKHTSKEAHLSHKDVLLLLLVSTLLLLSEKIKLHGSSGSTSLPNGDKILLRLLKLLLRLA